ncbi:MAG TPA: hypothetical protein VF086_19645 [Propionibacteriaceae bacterium]
MERNVVSLETAKRLKAVGFPRVSMWHYSEGMDPSDELFFTQSSGSTQFDIAAPTAQEIADQLPGSWSVVNSKVTSNYHAAYHGSGGDRVNVDADTLAEALANLLLKLVDGGDLKFMR